MSHPLFTQSRADGFRLLSSIANATPNGVDGYHVTPPPIILSSRDHLLRSIGDALATGLCPTDVLAAAIAVIAGFELEFGTREAAYMHLRAFSNVMNSDSPYASPGGLEGGSEPSTPDS